LIEPPNLGEANVKVLVEKSSALVKITLKTTETIGELNTTLSI